MKKQSKRHDPQIQKDWGGHSSASVIKIEQRSPRPLPGQSAQQQHDDQLSRDLARLRKSEGLPAEPKASARTLLEQLEETEDAEIGAKRLARIQHQNKEFARKKD